MAQNYDGSKYFQKQSGSDVMGNTTTFGVGAKEDTTPGNKGNVLWVRDANYSNTGT